MRHCVDCDWQSVSPLHVRRRTISAALILPRTTTRASRRLLWAISPHGEALCSEGDVTADLQLGLKSPTKAEPRDPFDEFIAECLEPASGAFINASALYGEYCGWARAREHRVATQTLFGREMARRVKRQDGRVRKYVDVRLLSRRDPEVDRETSEAVPA